MNILGSIKNELNELLFTIIEWFSADPNKRINTRDESLEISDGGKDIAKLSPKQQQYIYLNTHEKIYQILCGVYDGYESHPEHVFIAVDDMLNDLYIGLHNTWLILDRIPFINDFKLGQYIFFKSLNNDPTASKHMWDLIKSSIKTDLNFVKENIPVEQLPDDLQLAFSKIDKLLPEHIVKKNKILLGDAIVYKKVILHKAQNTITITDGKPINITSNPLRLLRLTLENIGKPVTFEQITKIIVLPKDIGFIDSSVKLDINQLKKDIARVLIENGVEKTTAKEIRGYIKSVRNIGYILRHDN